MFLIAFFKPIALVCGKCQMSFTNTHIKSIATESVPLLSSTVLSLSKFRSKSDTPKQALRVLEKHEMTVLCPQLLEGWASCVSRFNKDDVISTLVTCFKDYFMMVLTPTGRTFLYPY